MIIFNLPAAKEARKREYQRRFNAGLHGMLLFVLISFMISCSDKGNGNLSSDSKLASFAFQPPLIHPY